MNAFAEILQELGAPPGGPWHIGDDPPLTVNYNGITGVLVATLNTNVHITIYQTSWDGQAQIINCTGGLVNVGPYCLHTTAIGQTTTERWFRQYRDGSWDWVTDCGTPTPRYLKAFDAMMNTLGPYLM